MRAQYAAAVTIGLPIPLLVFIAVLRRASSKMLTSSRCGSSLSVAVLLFISQAALSSAQDAPQITINGSESVSVVFEEEKGQLPLFSGGNRVSITDTDSGNLSEAILILTPGGSTSTESLRLNMAALPQGIATPQSNYQSEQGILSITTEYTLAEYESILSAVEYASTNRNPDDTMQRRPIVICRVQDVTGQWSNNLTIAIDIVAFNDPPVIYLAGPSQLNNSLVFSLESSPLSIVDRTQVHIQDPDTTDLQSIRIELESETRNGDPIDLGRESLSSASPVLARQGDTNVYISITSISHGLLAATLETVQYINSDPLATINGTRVVRITAVDVDLTTTSGSQFPGMISQPSFVFIRVGDEPVAPTTQVVSTTTTTEPQVPPITTTESETDVPDVTTMTSTSASIVTDGTTEFTTGVDPTIDATTTELQVPPITTTETDVMTMTSTTSASITTDGETEFITGVDPTIDTTVTTVPASCPEELNVPLVPGSTLGLLVYNWTQTSVGEGHIGQPCPMVCQELAGVSPGMRPLGEVQRSCVGGEREGEAEWSPVVIDECGLSTTALQLCENILNMGDTEADIMLTDAVVNITNQPEKIDTSVIAVTTTLIENLTQTAIQQPEVRENYLRVIDNILSADQATIVEGQVRVNSSARLLESLRIFSENAPIGATAVNGSTNDTSGNSENFIVYALDNFGLILEDVEVDNFTGEAFSVDLGPVREAIQGSGRISEESLIRMASALPNATVAVVVPESLFDTDTHYQNVVLSKNSTSNESDSLIKFDNTSVHTHRLIFSVFLQNSIFQDERTNCSKKAIGSVIASLHINSSAYRLANASIKAIFQENRQACEDKEIPEEAEPVCSIFQVESNSIRYSSEDCQLISTEGGVAKCECSQPGHFGLLFDLKPGDPFLPQLLKIASYIGACLSILCLLLVLIIYLSSRDLRSTKQGHQGQLVINTSFALLGLYVVFILAGHVTSVRPLCGLTAALLQFFILAYFSWTSVEALLLLFKIVRPLHKFGKYFVLKASLFSWLMPLIVIAVSVGSGHGYYISDFYCRSFDKPFYFGTILPALLLYFFNWIIFIVILFSFLRKYRQMSVKDADSAVNTSSTKKLKTYFTLIVVLSFFFGLGWGFGLAATTSDIQELTFIFQLLFCIFVGSQGILVFILHCVRPQQMRKKWKSWCKTLMKRSGLDSLQCCRCCRLNLTEMHPKSPAESKNKNGYSAQYFNYHEGVKDHHVATTTPPHNALEIHTNIMDTVGTDGQFSAKQYELIQSAPYYIQTSNSSSTSFQNPSYVAISPPKRTQTLPQASAATDLRAANKRKVRPLESIPYTETTDIDD